MHLTARYVSNPDGHAFQLFVVGLFWHLIREVEI